MILQPLKSKKNLVTINYKKVVPTVGDCYQWRKKKKRKKKKRQPVTIKVTESIRAFTAVVLNSYIAIF